MFVFVGAGVSPAEASPTDEDGGDSSSERSSSAGEMASKLFCTVCGGGVVSIKSTSWPE